MGRIRPLAGIVLGIVEGGQFNRWICRRRVAFVLLRARAEPGFEHRPGQRCVSDASRRRKRAQDLEVLLVESVGVEVGTEVLVRDETSGLAKDGATGPRV